MARSAPSTGALPLLLVLAGVASVAGAASVDPCYKAPTNVSHLDDNLFGGEFEGWRIAVISILCWIITSFAVAAGIGGGGLLMPLYKIGFGLPVGLAVPISKATIFGVAIGNFFFISRERHPKVDRPLIDYGTAVFMQGGELMGVVIGVLFNLLLSEVRA